MLVQVLRDPATREAYDQQLSLTAAKQQIFISHTIDLADMELGQVADSTQASSEIAYRYPCRCGGDYWLESMAAVEHGSAFAQCDTCSLNLVICLSP